MGYTSSRQVCSELMQRQHRPSKVTMEENSWHSLREFWKSLPDSEFRAERCWVRAKGHSFVFPISWALPNTIPGPSKPRRMGPSNFLYDFCMKTSCFITDLLPPCILFYDPGLCGPETTPSAASPRPSELVSISCPFHMPHLMSDPEVTVANLLWSLGLWGFCAAPGLWKIQVIFCSHKPQGPQSV